METAHGEIDQHRPWIRDERDDPGAMNWAETLLNPLGETSKLHFSRAWTFMFLGRVVLYMVPSMLAAILGISGVGMDAINTPVNLLLLTIPAVLVPFALFTFLTDFTSFVAHTRRLADAGRPTWLAVIVLVPMILGLAAYAGGTVMGAAQYRAANAPPAAVAEGEAAAEPAKRPERRERRGPPGPPKSERETAVASGVSMGFSVWALGSFGVMIWTLVYVARLPNGGQGRLRTGSDLTPDEIADGL